jgi:hypothetical protein
MPDSTRRGFLALTGGGVAAAGAAAVAPALLAGGRDAGAAGPDLPEVKVDGPLIAYVSDVSTGELVVMVGEQEISAIDRELVGRIARLTRTGN